jgi:N-acetylmuramoyl-L-alanine amidase
MTDIAVRNDRPFLTRPPESALKQPALEIAQMPLPYTERLDRRLTTEVDLLLIHGAECADFAALRARAERVRYACSSTGDATHFVIDRDGALIQQAPLDRVAHHVRGYNGRSIGVSLINRGRGDAPLNHDAVHGESFAAPQLDALVSLSLHLRLIVPTLLWIAGHDELDIGEIPSADAPERLVKREYGLGPAFPWDAVRTRSRLKPLLLGAA